MRRNGIKRGKKNLRGCVCQTQPKATLPATPKAPLGGCHYVQVWVAKGEDGGARGPRFGPLISFFMTSSHRQ